MTDKANTLRNERSECNGPVVHDDGHGFFGKINYLLLLIT